MDFFPEIVHIKCILERCDLYKKMKRQTLPGNAGTIHFKDTFASLGYEFLLISYVGLYSYSPKFTALLYSILKWHIC